MRKSTKRVDRKRGTKRNNLFKALADPTRRAIFEQLAGDGEQTVHALTDRAGVSQPAVSKHLGHSESARYISQCSDSA
jgi:DNA-binding transcriptional ArsR family regulator